MSSYACDVGTDAPSVENRIAALPFDSLLAISRSATSSRVLDVLLTSPTVPPRGLRTFIMSLLGHYAVLADDRIGSRVAERCFASADVYLKDKIAQSLFDQQNDLQRSAYAHFFARKLELPLWGRKREDWKAKMARITNEEKARLKAENDSTEAQAKAAIPGGNASAAATAAAEGSESKRSKKKRERKADEVDEIFASAAGGASTAPLAGDGERPAKKKSKRESKRAIPAQEGMEDVMAAIKASV